MSEELKNEKVIKEVKQEEKTVGVKKEDHKINPPRATVRVILKNTAGKDMKEEDYFFGGVAPKTFNIVCGLPVVREDLIEVFHKVFKESENFLFYKSPIKEVYIIVIPLKNATTVGAENDSPEGDFQKHSISFLSEGSVNLDTLKAKLQRILTFVKFTDR